jgi:chloramphenicol-sensitive protein RarD
MPSLNVLFPMLLPPHNRGLATLLFAYAIWGLFPVYWKTLVQIDAVELLLTRLILTALACMLLLPLRGTLPDYLNSWRQPATLRRNFYAAILLSLNWFSFIWAVNSGNVLESSLGYFLCPIVSILLGRLIFKERLGTARWIAVCLAIAGVAGMVILAGRVPIAAIVIALTWSGYSVIKKKSQVGPVVALGLETSLLAPVAATVLLWMLFSDRSTLPQVGPVTFGFLAISGIVTAVPLLLFAYAAPKVRMSTIGMAQYIVPSGHFLLAIYYGETVNVAVLMSFALIWIGLVLFTVTGPPSKIRASP